MKIKLYKSEDRGATKNSWLTSFHSFSFADYFDPLNMGAGALRVLNDDTIKPQSGFPMHSHRNMEIVTIILKGKLTHADNLGNEKTLGEGEVQTMTAGVGVTHSEYNNEKNSDVSLLQIWVRSKQKNLISRYEQKVFRKSGRENKWQVIVSPNLPNSLHINQSAYFSLSEIPKKSIISYDLFEKSQGVFVFVIKGSIKIENEILNKGDAIFIEEIAKISLETLKKSYILAIEVPLE
ncbi:MAG: pirin family protein [bacterium]|nr:pirin family protein [bacterium]